MIVNRQYFEISDEIRKLQEIGGEMIPDTDTLRTRRIALEKDFDLDTARNLLADMEAAGWIYNTAMLRRKIAHYESQPEPMPDYTDK